MALRTSSTKRGDVAYFAPLIHLIKEDPDVPELFYRYLVTRDIADFNPRIIPATLPKNEMIVSMRPPVAHFLQHFVQNPPMGLVRHDTRGADKPFHLSKSFAYAEYMDWSKNQPPHLRAKTMPDFSNAMKKLGFTNLRTEHSHIDGRSMYCWSNMTMDRIREILENARAWDVEAET